MELIIIAIILFLIIKAPLTSLYLGGALSALLALILIISGRKEGTVGVFYILCGSLAFTAFAAISHFIF